MALLKAFASKSGAAAALRSKNEAIAPKMSSSVMRERDALQTTALPMVLCEHVKMELQSAT